LSAKDQRRPLPRTASPPRPAVGCRAARQRAHRGRDAYEPVARAGRRVRLRASGRDGPLDGRRPVAIGGASRTRPAQAGNRTAGRAGGVGGTDPELRRQERELEGAVRRRPRKCRRRE